LWAFLFLSFCVWAGSAGRRRAIGLSAEAGEKRRLGATLFSYERSELENKKYSRSASQDLLRDFASKGEAKYPKGVQFL
jgi:hypothetical protein